MTELDDLNFQNTVYLLKNNFDFCGRVKRENLTFGMIKSLKTEGLIRRTTCRCKKSQIFVVSPKGLLALTDNHQKV